jgi:Tol biopolymer transport system component
MPLVPGTRLGPYEIAAPLGAGGMGEVYRARDTRLDRTVAIKVLVDHRASDPELRQRFEREARAISALNHSHICVLHDIGRQDRIDFLVMEYLEGETLANRLRRGALPLEQALRYGIEIADALGRAHRQGIVHRDLKPGNVMLTKSGTKLLDFGLAKLRGEDGTVSELSERPTEARPLTAEGSIVGTVQYMAPEQLEGRAPDARSDIFALGTVLYEMVTGRRAFTGKSQASLIAAILRSDPVPMSNAQPVIPHALDHVVATCLAKDPDARWQDVDDVARVLQWIAAGGARMTEAVARPAGRRREWLAWAAAATLAALLALAIPPAVKHGREKPPLQVRLELAPPERTTLTAGMALSPDGDRLVFSALGDTTSHLYLRPLNSSTSQRIPGTDGGLVPFWSPDGRELGFVAQGMLKKVDLATGAVQSLCALRVYCRGASWGRHGIIFADGEDLFRIPATGGAPQPLGKRAEGETARSWPHFLPDGRRYLYVSLSERPEERGLYAASLDSSARNKLVSTGMNVAYSRTGHLLFVRSDVLVAQAFDLDRLELSGEAVRVSDHVAIFGAPVWGAAFTSSAGGVVAWQAGLGSAGMQLSWFDRTGRTVGTVGDPASYSNPALSPDGRMLAVSRLTATGTGRDIWAYDLVRGTSTRLTFDAADDINPSWSPDGTRIAFTSDRSGIRQIYQTLANGSGEDELLVESKDWWKNVEDWSPDGRFLLFNYYRGGSAADLFLLPLAPGIERKPIPFISTGAVETMGQFSPDGRWIAYHSDESGRGDVYVRGVATDGTHVGGKRQVSTAGGIDPKWRGDGREMFYLSGSTLMAVDVKADGGSFEAGIPKPLFEARLPTAIRRNRYVVTRDGQRFLMATPTEVGAAPIHVLVNWAP